MVFNPWSSVLDSNLVNARKKGARCASAPNRCYEESQVTTPDFSRSFFGICAAAALLAACGVTPPPISAAGTTARTSSLTRQASDGDLLYVPGRGQSYVLAYPGGRIVGTISGGGEVACSDASGEVFLVQGLSVTEYTHGATTPSATLTIPGNLSGGGASVYRLAIVGSAATIAGTTRFKTFSKNVSQSWIAGNRIFMPFGRKSIDGRTPTLGVWKYPAGGKPTSTFKGINGDGKTADVYGAALSVAPH